MDPHRKVAVPHAHVEPFAHGRIGHARDDVAVALGTPFISGKDSLNNEFSYVDASGEKKTIAIPPSLLISAMGQVDDVGRCVTMDLKSPGNRLYLVGQTKDELGGSHFALVNELDGGAVPTVDPLIAKQTFAAMHTAIRRGLVRSCHDLSEGGLAAAAAEMAFAGGVGARLDLSTLPKLSTACLLFSESNSRFLCEITPDSAAPFEAQLAGVPCACVGQTVQEPRLVIAAQQGDAAAIDESLDQLKAAWQRPLNW
ncbi:MAG: hypothetical protein IH898_01975 [Planctomycetes bacterium]|nr:hypothetical protein [Planctomycetota bacterium]